MDPGEVFISHSHVDVAFVERLVGLLAAHGVASWHSDSALLGAQQWHDEIGAALRRARWFLIVLSPDSVASYWVKQETVYAVRQVRLIGHIIPVICRPCDPEPLSWTIENL